MISRAQVAILLLFASSAPAYAYLDPGTGSLVLQGIIAAIAAGLGAVSIFWSRLRSMMSRIFGRSRDRAGDGRGADKRK